MDEHVISTIEKDGKLIVHIGKSNSNATRFFIYSREMAQEVRDVLDIFINGGEQPC